MPVARKALQTKTVVLEELNKIGQRLYQTVLYVAKHRGSLKIKKRVVY